jgi:hypothetical protein
MHLPEQSYSAFMKNLRVIPPFLAALLASLLIASSAAAQNVDGPTTNELPVRDEIVAARSPYTQMPDISPVVNEGKSLAQLPRARPGMPIPPRHGYYQGSYQNPWMGSGDVAHPRIGAAIGFGFGAAIGALSSIHNQTPVGSRVILGGSLFALIGGAIGAAHVGSHPFMQRRRFYPPSWPDDDEEGNLRSPSRTKESQKEPSVSTAPALTSQPAGVEALAAPSPGRPAVP